MCVCLLLACLSFLIPLSLNMPVLPCFTYCILCVVTSASHRRIWFSENWLWCGDYYVGSLLATTLVISIYGEEMDARMAEGEKRTWDIDKAIADPPGSPEERRALRGCPTLGWDGWALLFLWVTMLTRNWMWASS